MTSPLHDLLSRFREADRARTPGPWRQSDGHKGYKNYVIQTTHFTRDVWEIAACYHDGEIDAAFIALCGSEIGKLLDVVYVMEKALQHYLNYIPPIRMISPESAAFEREYGAGKIAREALAESERIAEGK